MKTFITLLILVLLGIGLSFGQCQFTQLGVGQGLYAIDSATIQESHTRCTQCPTGGVVSWEFVGDVNYQFTLYSEDSNLVSVQITKGCNLLLWDTCGVLPPMSMGAVWAFTKCFSVYGDCQIHINGVVGQQIYIDIKASPHANEQLDDVIIDLNTCNLPTSTTEPQPTEPTYYRLSDLMHPNPQPVKASERVPNVAYKRIGK